MKLRHKILAWPVAFIGAFSLVGGITLIATFHWANEQLKKWRLAGEKS